MHLEILVEEPSAEKALQVLVPKIVGEAATFQIRVLGSTPVFWRKLPERLRAYRHLALSAGIRVVVLVDQDRQDCKERKARLEEAARSADLLTKSAAAPGSPFMVLNRVAVEELEAWFFGDCDAIRAVYPRVPAWLESKEAFREPDEIAGGTWEALERVLQRAGYHPGGLPKTQVAEAVARHMDPSRNRSPSFRHFCVGLRALIERKGADEVE